MERFAKDCINVFCELTGCDKTKIGTAPTPFIDESKDPLIVIQEATGPPAKAGAHNPTVTNQGPKGRLRKRGSRASCPTSPRSA